MKPIYGMDTTRHERSVKTHIIISPADNVAVALDTLASGQCVEGIVLNAEGGTRQSRELSVKQDIARGHKFALRPIAQGENVIKYGNPIGHATCDIEAGEWVHSHNMATNLGAAPLNPPEGGKNLDSTDVDSKGNLSSSPLSGGLRGAVPVLQAYLRPDGRMGIRNELWIIPTVGCIVGQAEAIRQRVLQECDLTGVDDVVVMSHNYGCSQLGDDHANTRRALAALATHPNAGGVLLLGLGCENNQMAGLLEEIETITAPLAPPEGGKNLDSTAIESNCEGNSSSLPPSGGLRGAVRVLIAQEVDDEVQCGFEACCELIDQMHHDRRQPLPLSMLRIGLKCGGSDGLSGITANPLLGRLTDYLTSLSGTAVLTEVPEMFGAEHLLMARAENRDVFDRTVALVNDFKDYFTSHNQPIYENPSPGNRAGGITTLEEKSLGCVQKGGQATVTDVLRYGDPIRRNGLNLLSAPGNDLVASTALALSGCHIVLFTTGRGTPFGTVVPTLKVATNTPLAEGKPHWIDFNAGCLVEGADPDETMRRLLQLVIAVASGELVCHERHHAKSMAIFKTGVTL